MADQAGERVAQIGRSVVTADLCGSAQVASANGEFGSPFGEPGVARLPAGEAAGARVRGCVVGGVEVLGGLPQPGPARSQVIALGLRHRAGPGGMGIEQPVQSDDVRVERVQLGAVCGNGPGREVDRPVEVEGGGGEGDEVRSRIGQGAVGMRGALR